MSITDLTAHYIVRLGNGLMGITYLTPPYKRGKVVRSDCLTFPLER